MYKAILIFLSIFIISCSSNDKEDIISDQSLYENNLLEDYELYERANIHISNNQLNLALTELKKWKDKLDLELITQEEFDAKKTELAKLID